MKTPASRTSTIRAAVVARPFSGHATSGYGWHIANQPMATAPVFTDTKLSARRPTEASP